jgi:cation diffusion facilitator family transporter
MHVASYLKLSAAVALATIALKTAAWWMTDSVGLLSDALESIVNLAGASFALVMVTLASRPPDAEHPFGHHKAEYFSSGFEGVLIIVAAVAIGWAAVHRLITPQPLEALGLGLTLSVLAAALNGALAWAMLNKARTARSEALEADARHLFTDVWTTAGVVGGLLAVMATGWLWLDPVLALLVAANILRVGWRLMQRAVSGLMDSAVDADTQSAIDAVLARFADRPVRFDHLATRRVGPMRFLEMHLHLPPGWTLGEAAALGAEVEAALAEGVPGLRASIQLLPEAVEPRHVPSGPAAGVIVPGEARGAK